MRSETVARVIASGGIRGRFAEPICTRDVTLQPAGSALYTYALTRESRAIDRPMVLDTGGLLTPHGVARYAAVTDPDALVDLVDELGYRALAFGVEELGAPRESLLDVLRGLRGAHIPAIATNLRCADAAVPLCDVLVDASDGPSMHTVKGRSMAVLAFLPPSAAHQVAPDLASGITIAPVAESMTAAVRLARERGAEIVIAVAALDAGDALTLALELPEDGRPDLLLLAGEGEMLFARPATVVPAIAAAPAGDAVEVLIREGLLRAGYEMVAQPLGGRGVDVGRPVRRLVQRIGDDYCEQWGSRLGSGTLSRPIDHAALAELAGRIVLDATDADVAILNLDAVDRRWRPGREGALTASDVYVALEYDEPIVVADVSSVWLAEVARRSAQRRLVTPGLTPDGLGARVLGRPLQARASYRVATLRFLASGGDDALPPLPSGAVWRPIERGTLRSLVLERLGPETDRDPRDVVSDPRDAPEWIAQGTIDGSFSGSSIDNPSGYTSALLNRGSTIALGLEVNLRADATAPAWSWENVGVLRYRAQWAPSAPGMAGAFQEAVDQIQVRSLGAWRGLRERPGDWYVPDPFIEVFAESELSEPMGRGWHWFLVRPTIGARFPLTNELELKLAVGIQAQVLDPAAEVEGGLGSTITLRPWDLARIEERHITVQGLVDWFIVDLGDQNRWQLRGSVDATFDLIGPFALTLGVRVYAQQENGNQVGLALDATAGLRLGWLGRAVGP